jgi:hypothetical protein
MLIPLTTELLESLCNERGMDTSKIPSRTREGTWERRKLVCLSPMHDDRTPSVSLTYASR